jgi:putative tryptophan/tyrosine transport system substrate-binding protein
LGLLNRELLVEFCATNRLPAIYQSEFFAEAGGLMTWAPSQPNQLRIAARYVDRILRGSRPGDLPVVYPPRYFLTINKRTLGDLGLKLPRSIKPDFFVEH